MCGIGGILRVHPPGAEPPPPEVSIPEAWLDIIDESIKHRGPDGQGRFRDRARRADGAIVDVALVHRRMSVIDIGGGAQPMVSAAGSSGATAQGADSLLFQGAPDAGVEYLRLSPLVDLVSVVFNGCIYNHRSLRRELEAAGHHFATDHSDTEVLIHGWRAFGRQLFSRVEGMYACAIWDRRSATLALARDPFGEKPLYATRDDVKARSGITVFASCPSGVRTIHAIATPNSGAEFGVRSWIKFGWNQTTPYQGVWEQNTGHVDVFPQKNSESVQKAAPDDPPLMGHWGDVLAPSGHRLQPDEVDQALKRSVEARLEADVPLGCFLSGGIDSALVCHYAKQLRPDITAFTVRMPHPDYDESDAAAATAKHLGVRHEILDCQASPAEDLVNAITQLGLPFGDSSLLPSIWVSRAARQRVKVALSGDGGDELFLGYDRYRALKMLSRLTRVPKEVIRAAAAMVDPGADPKSKRSRFSRLLNAAVGDGYKELVAIFPHPYDRQLGLGNKFLWHFGMTPMAEDQGDLAMFARRFDLMFYLPYDLMRKSDTASMSVALEVRAPFLAPDVARLGIHASIESLMPRGERKGLLRAVARRYLPAEIVDRPKMGFAIPIGEWFRTDYGGMKTLLLDHLNAVDPWPGIGVELSRTFVRQMIDEHMGEKRDHSQRLYMLLVLSIWARSTIR